MAKPNKNFNLNVKDIDIIEHPLRLQMSMASMYEKKEINELLGKLYNQKQFFRPSNQTYVSG